MVPPADNPAPLSVTRAFVVQFWADTAVEQGHLAGRVEHVISGQATDFESLERVMHIERSARCMDVEMERHPGARWDPDPGAAWIPACAGMTTRATSAVC